MPSKPQTPKLQSPRTIQTRSSTPPNDQQADTATASTKTPPIKTAPKKRGADESLVNARLRALFPGAAAKAQARERGEREVEGAFKMLPHTSITVRSQVRRTFAQEEMDELRASIREMHTQNAGIEGSGVLQALLVSPLHDEAGVLTGYRLIAGEKRFRATREEGLSEIPCIVIPETGESLIRLMQLTENALRTSPPVVDEALAMRDTMTEMGLSLRDMARLLGKSLGYVTERLNLLKTGLDIQEMVFARANTLRHARLIDPVTDSELRADLIAAALEGAGEREIRRRIVAWQAPQEEAQTIEQGSGHPASQGAAVQKASNDQNTIEDISTNKGSSAGFASSTNGSTSTVLSNHQGAAHNSFQTVKGSETGKDKNDSLTPVEGQSTKNGTGVSGLEGRHSASDEASGGVDTLRILQPIAQSLQQAIQHYQSSSINSNEKRQLLLAIADVRKQLHLLEQSVQ